MHKEISNIDVFKRGFQTCSLKNIPLNNFSMNRKSGCLNVLGGALYSEGDSLVFLVPSTSARRHIRLRRLTEPVLRRGCVLLLAVPSWQ